MTKNPKAVIFGCKSTKLTSEEKKFFSRIDPLGFILFARNCEKPDQVQALISEMKDATGREDVPILIDQEGGRVQRLNPPYWRAAPPASVFGMVAEDDLDLAVQSAEDNAWLIGSELEQLGINTNCAPTADVLVEGASSIIGDRSFGEDPELVAKLAFHVVLGLLESGVRPIIKHFPGHGRAPVDSHEVLPSVFTGRDELQVTDFSAFRQLCDLIEGRHLQDPNFPMPWGMTCHVLYNDIDPYNPATHSSLVINNVIRGEINFQGFLITDCLAMKALEGPYEERAAKSIDAGCDAVLYCSADLDHMIEVASAVDHLPPESMKRLQKSQISAKLGPVRSEEKVLYNLNKALKKYEALLEEEEHDLQKVFRE